MHDKMTTEGIIVFNTVINDVNFPPELLNSFLTTNQYPIVVIKGTINLNSANDLISSFYSVFKDIVTDEEVESLTSKPYFGLFPSSNLKLV